MSAIGTQRRVEAIRDRIAHLRTLDPDQAREVEETWPLTLASLDGPETAIVVNLPAWRIQDMLARELAERITETEATDR